MIDPDDWPRSPEEAAVEAVIQPFDLGGSFYFDMKGAIKALLNSDWLAEHDREVAAGALEDLMRDSLGAFMGEVLRQRAADIRNPLSVSTSTGETDA